MVIDTGTIAYDQNGREYEVVEFVDAGSFGNVYKIREKDKGSIFALKSIQTPFTDETILKAFINEGRLATKISHKNVISYFFFHDGSQYERLPPYIIMEYAEGGTLSAILQARGRKNDFFANTQLERYFAQLIDGMEAINRTLVHRDIKPDNILIANKTLKISDFGLSKIVTEGTRTSTFKGIGCIPYLAPEGWRFEKNTILMDIYSMGIVFYELSTLQHPLTASNRDLRSWQDAHLFQTPDRPDVINRDLSPTFSHLIMKMIEKKPNMRFQNWQAVREMLKSESFPRTPDSELVESVLRKRIEIDQKERDEETKKLKMDREIEELKKLVQFQLQNEVINPLKTFVEEINAKYSGAKNRIASSRDGFTYTLTTSAHKSLTFVVKPIIEKEFYRERVSNDYGRKTERTELQIPTYNGKQLLAWGYIKAEDGRGMNLLLLKEQQQPYGSWYLLTNKTSAFTDRQRPTPFPFEFDEIEKELQLVKAMHIYVSQGEPLNIGKLKEFVTEYI